MTAEELIAHQSVQREFARFRSLGGKVTICTNEITLHVEGIIPIDIAEAFMLRIKELDTSNQLQIFVAK